MGRGDTGDADSPIDIYRNSVIRAASDRSRRIRREVALLAFLNGQSRVEEFEGAALDWELAEFDDDPEEDEAYSDEEIPLVGPTAP